MTEVRESRAVAGHDIMPLLQPLKIGQLRLRNRFVMPGMQRGLGVDGDPDLQLRDYYRRRALGGTALVISESCAVDHPSSASNPIFARIGPKTRHAWRSCIEAVKEADGRMFPQLWHLTAERSITPVTEVTDVAPDHI